MQKTQEFQGGVGRPINNKSDGGVGRPIRNKTDSMITQIADQRLTTPPTTKNNNTGTSPKDISGIFK